MDKARFISGISMALLVTGLILFTPDMPLWFVFNIIISLCCLEFVRLRFSNLTASIWSISFFALAYLIKDLLIFNLIFITLSFSLWIFLIPLILAFPHNKSFLQSSKAWILFGVISFLGFSAGVNLILFNQFALSPEFNIRGILLFIICIAAFTDVFAYFIGKSLGKRKFLQNVSPKKTLEGFIGGVILASLFLSISISIFKEVSFVPVLLLTLITSIFSIIGDASASLFKRVSGTKDSSNLIPGHGGIFDRIDSHLAAFPVFLFFNFFVFHLIK
ncbi:MAG: phosphatidate cytidylyltransferase [Pseudomonadota bacterium]|nr:phosphatidate cytidylyltransferase [Pseudomonadota bacterium]